MSSIIPDLKTFEAWFITGSQHLYGPETLRQVDEHSAKIVEALNASSIIPIRIVFKPVVKSPEEIYSIIKEANNADNVIGIITWMHTFSPAKMWINGLKVLAKPMLHLHTQFNRDIPYATIDMDFMNLTQSAHGDREFGFINTRMRIERKVVTGHYADPAVQDQINVWARAASAWYDWQGAKFVRFGDNMRQVAVTEGDKVEAQIKFGYEVNTHGVGDLVAVINAIPEADVNALVQTYLSEYNVQSSLLPGGEQHQSLIEAARIEAGLRKFLTEGGYKGYTNSFEDLHGMVQLPGIPSQRLMADGYGYGGEGDWKTSALVHAMKVMGSGLKGGNSFMEDYTYHFEPGNEQVLGSHMLEICPSIANAKPNCEIHPLGIGGKADPVRLVFNSGAGAALNATIIDMGNRFRMIVNEVVAVEAEHEFPKLPVARAMWKPLPDMKTGCSAWIYAGGTHHSGYSQNLTTEYFEDFAAMAGIEIVVIDKDTNLRQLKNELKWSEVVYK